MNIYLVDSKYVVKNCISYEDGICDQQDMFCKDCADCLLKWIICKCQHMRNELDQDILNGNYPDKYKYFKSGRSDAGQEILNLLKIEEINE